MNIAVLVKQVPASGQVTAGAGFTPDREKNEQAVNPADLNALEEALSLKDSQGKTVTVITMGPACAENMLRRMAAMGADRLILVSDPAFAGSDTYATAITLSRTVAFLGGFDLILCGRRTTDGETGQVGPETAALLNIPCVTNCVGLSVSGREITCRRMLEKEYQQLRLKLPALITVYNSINSPRLISLKGLSMSRKIPTELLTAESLGFSAGGCGLEGSFTRVHSVTARPYGKRRPVRAAADETGIELVLEAIRNSDKAGE